MFSVCDVLLVKKIERVTLLGQKNLDIFQVEIEAPFPESILSQRLRELRHERQGFGEVDSYQQRTREAGSIGDGDGREVAGAPFGRVGLAGRRTGCLSIGDQLFCNPGHSWGNISKITKPGRL